MWNLFIHDFWHPLIQFAVVHFPKLAAEQKYYSTVSLPPFSRRSLASVRLEPKLFMTGEPGLLPAAIK
jgi:hypothetical protein